MTAEAESDVRLPYLRKYGWQSMAYSSLQKGMEYFLLPDVGYVSFSPIQGKVVTPVVLGDPICDRQNMGQMIDAFIAKYDDPIFMHITAPTAKILEQRGFYINEIGVETLIDVQQFTTKGGPKETLRQQCNRAKKDGLHVGELDIREVSKEEQKSITDEWLNKKANHDNELGFLVRPAVYDDELDVRKFFALKEWKIQGFVFFDPIYENGEVIGYMANILRTLGHLPYSLTDYIIVEAIGRLRQEGKKVLSLGWSPFVHVEDDGQFKHSKPLKELFRYTYDHCNYLYAFQSLAFHKDRYRPGLENTQQQKVYAATRHLLPVHMLHEIFRKMGMHPVTQTGECAIKCINEAIAGVPAELKKLLAATGKHLEHHEH